VAANYRTTGFNTTAVVLLSAAAGILIWALVLFLQGGFMAAQASEFRAKTYGSVNEEVREYRASQQAILDEKPRWLDRDQGTVVLPIDDAKSRIVEKHAGQ